MSSYQYDSAIVDSVPDVMIDTVDNEACGLATIPTKTNDIDSTALSTYQRSSLPRRYSDAISTISDSTVSSFETSESATSEDNSAAQEDFEAYPVERLSMVFVGVQGPVPQRKARRGGKKLFFPGRC